MEIIGTHIAISWDYCIPYYYGEYRGKLKNGEDCRIDVDWKIKAYTAENKQVGTDQILYWLCNSDNVKTLIENIKK